MTINISKRKEALMNIIMCRREISPNVRCPQALILLNYRLSVELQCTHPKLKLNVMILFTSFMERHLCRRLKNQYKFSFTISLLCPQSSKGPEVASFPLHFTVLACWCSIDTAMYAFFSPKLSFLGFCKKLQLYNRLLFGL